MAPQPFTLTASSTLTSRFQTTVPELVRTALGLKKQDKLEYVISDKGTVTIQKVVIQEEDPALLPFLNMLAQDMQQNPKNILSVSADEIQKSEQLIAGINVDLDEPL